MRDIKQRVEHRRAIARMNRSSHKAMRWCATITDVVLAAAEDGRLVMDADAGAGALAKLESIERVVLGTSSDLSDVSERIELIERYLNQTDRIAYLERRNADLMRRNFDLSQQLHDARACLAYDAAEAPNAG